MKIRLNKAIKEFGVGFSTVADFLKKKGHPIQDDDLNQKLDDEQYDLLKEAFGADKDLKTKAEEMMQNRQKSRIQSYRIQSKRILQNRIQPHKIQQNAIQFPIQFP